MIVTPQVSRLSVERNIAPPLALAVTIPLSIDLRHSMHDGFVVYVGYGAFCDPARDTPLVLKAIAEAIAEHLKSLPPVMKFPAPEML